MQNSMLPCHFHALHTVLVVGPASKAVQTQVMLYAGARKRKGEAWTAGTSSKTMAQMEKRKKAVADKLGVKKNSGVVKKSKAAANKAATLAGKASEAEQSTATAVKDAATAAVQSVQKVDKAVEERSK